MTSHLPNQREQMVRYYGFYSNVSRGIRQKEKQDDYIPRVIEQEKTKSSKWILRRLGDFKP